MLSLGLSIDFRDWNLNEASGLLSKDIWELFLSPVHLKVQEKNGQLCRGSFKPQSELETKRSRPTCQLQSRLVRCNLENPASTTGES